MRRDQTRAPEPMRSTLPNTDQPRIPHSEYHHTIHPQEDEKKKKKMARVIPGAPRLAADCICRKRLGGYGSRRLSDGLAPPRRPTPAAATGCSGRTSERSRDVVVGRVTFEVQGREKLGLRRSRLFLRRRRLCRLC